MHYEPKYYQKVICFTKFEFSAKFSRVSISGLALLIIRRAFGFTLPKLFCLSNYFCSYLHAIIIVFTFIITASYVFHYLVI